MCNGVFFLMSLEQVVELEKKLWSAADELRANSELKSSEYLAPLS
jgi:type I restriction enzyme M protein